MNSVEQIAGRAKTGIWGLDNILSGGFSRGHVFLADEIAETARTIFASESEVGHETKGSEIRDRGSGSARRSLGQSYVGSSYVSQMFRSFVAVDKKYFRSITLGRNRSMSG